MPPRKKANGQTALPGMPTMADLRDTLWKAADKLRGSMDAAQYKDFVLGLVFLKYVSDAFDERREQIRQEVLDQGIAETRLDQFLDDVDEYTGHGVFWVPADARWSHLSANAKAEGVGALIDAAMDAVMRANKALTGVLPKIFNRDNVDQRRLGELVDLISDARFTGHGDKPARDVLGEVYEYFLEKFARAEGKRGGEFYTPASVVKLLVEVLEPYSGRVYDPCCGSGGMFVQAEKFVLNHRGRREDIAVYGQESNERTWRLAKMNLAIHGITGDLATRWEDTFYADKHPDLRADYRPRQPAVQHVRLGTQDRRPTLEVRHTASQQRQLRLAATHRLQARRTRHRRRRPRQRIHVIQAVRRRRDPRRHGRSRPRRLHDRPATAAVPHDPDPGLPVVLRKGQGPAGREAPRRPAGRGAVHRRPQPWAPWWTAPSASSPRRTWRRSPAPTTPGGAPSPRVGRSTRTCPASATRRLWTRSAHTTTC